MNNLSLPANVLYEQINPSSNHSHPFQHGAFSTRVITSVQLPVLTRKRTNLKHVYGGLDNFFLILRHICK